MLKILIVCKENVVAKKLVNSIVAQINDLKLIGIANTLIEAQEIMIENKPDLILTTFDSIGPIVKETFILHLPKIFLISKSTDKNKEFRNISYIDGNLSYSQIKTCISNLLQKNTMSSKKEKVTKLLLDFGFDFKISGTNFLLDAILYTHSYEGSRYFERLGRDVYPYVAKINKTTTNKVAWSISRSVLYMYEKHTKYTYGNIEKYFKITYPEKPTPKLIINLIANNLDS